MKEISVGENWQEAARTLGWPARDIETLESVLAHSKLNDRVVRITSTWIEIESPVIYEFTGSGETSKLQHTRVWRWNYYPPPESRFEEIRETKPWCPMHAYGCEPDSEGCGIRDLIRIEVCGCGVTHRTDCEVWKAAMLEPAVIDALEDKPVHEWKPPVEDRVRPNRSNGWFLPGQMRLEST